MIIKKGDKAPEFTLYASDKSQVSLHDYAGKNLIILFFPAAFSSTCTEELCAMQDGLREFQSLNTNIVAISVDAFFTLAKFKELNGLNFPLLSDFNKEVSRAYDAFYDSWILDMKGVSKRAAFVVDKKGMIQYSEILEQASDLPNFAAIKKAVEGLN
jgi:peroxiredoxin